MTKTEIINQLLIGVTGNRPAYVAELKKWSKQELAARLERTRMLNACSTGMRGVPWTWM